MKMVFRIAKTELRTLFYSPIAWFLLIAFLVQCGLAYINALDGAARSQEIGGMSLENMTRLTERIFASRGGVFSVVMQTLYLYIPLLTMGLISREVNNGTIKLLYSSPVKVREIIFGKFLAMMVYNLLMMVVLGLFIFDGLIHINHADAGELFSASLGFYLLLCAYSAIGLFMSSLTSYQIVAAVCTFMMVGFLSYIGTLWQNIAFVRDLTYFLSLSGRTEKMLAGLITSKDVIYFLVIIYIFLALSIYKLKAGRESKPAVVKTGRYVAVVALGLVVGYITSRPSLVGYFDATANKTRTLTPNSQKILKELGDAPLEVTAYNNMLGSFYYFGSEEGRNMDLARWEPYMRFKQDIHLQYVQYYDSLLDNPNIMRFYPGKDFPDMATQRAKGMGLKLSQFKSPAEIRKIIDLRPELNRYVMQLKYKDKVTFLRVFDDQLQWPGEAEVAAALKRLLQSEFPRVAFLTGDLERSIGKEGDREYSTLTKKKTFRYALVNQGFDVDTLSLEHQDIPSDVTTLVIADPKKEFSAVTMAKIRKYISEGGNLLITGEPGKQSILNPLLHELGVQLMDGMIAQPAKETAPDLALPLMTSTAAGFSKSLVKGLKDSIAVSMPGATWLSYSDSIFKVQPLLVTDAGKSWVKKDRFAADSAEVVYDPAAGDEKKSVATVIALTRKVNNKEQRIVVTGDADFLSNDELGRYNVQTINFAFNTALFSWLSYGQFPIDTYRPEAKDTRVSVSTDAVDILRILYIWVLPGILVAFAAILLIRRKRK
ncbi:Gldg family protein [Chitinophaga ginsengisoli]|uniref:ABC-2 type transport system permease protein n=1 Tax=Chitinophaga ginsengisoli TaxID=363837 RepID=A0A2P8FTJ0_9BACT|nr:Gldg family protein [Chitinophaga ginsengisoli]PSL25047.1 ABC-2 type transport system permease protein [Chitinophaga ginsengisoli]